MNIVLVRRWHLFFVLYKSLHKILFIVFAAPWTHHFCRKFSINFMLKFGNCISLNTSGPWWWFLITKVLNRYRVLTPFSSDRRLIQRFGWPGALWFWRSLWKTILGFGAFHIGCVAVPVRFWFVEIDHYFQKFIDLNSFTFTEGISSLLGWQFVSAYRTRIMILEPGHQAVGVETVAAWHEDSFLTNGKFLDTDRARRHF